MIEKLHASPDVYRIRVVLPDNPLQYLNAYVIKGKSENLVIDTGFNRPECREALCRGLEDLGIDLRHTSLFFDAPPCGSYRPCRLLCQSGLPDLHASRRLSIPCRFGRRLDVEGC